MEEFDSAGGAYVPTVVVGMYAPLEVARSQTCRKTARLRHPRFSYEPRRTLSLIGSLC